MSGNPGGRPPQAKGFAARIREKTKDGEELITFAYAVLHADVDKLVPGLEDEKDPEMRRELRLHSIPCLKDRMEAKRWLADRGWGKTPEKFDEDDDIASMSDDELKDAVREELAKAEGNAPSTSVTQ